MAIYTILITVTLTEASVIGIENYQSLVRGVVIDSLGTEQALREAKLAVEYGYDMGLLSMGGLQDLTEAEILDCTRAVAQVIPVFGFYLQPSVGGRIFTYEFWTEFVNIENVEAIKCASFNRYQTLDVVRTIANSPRKDQIALYTGNDDNIVSDLISIYKFNVNGKEEDVQFRGGLLGHWAVWTSKAVELMDKVKSFKAIPTHEKWVELQVLANQTTDVNAVLFDVANDFHGCIPDIHEVLYRQGLMKGIWCLNPNEVLSKGQSEELTRVYQDYPTLHDDDFVKDFLNKYKGNSIRIKWILIESKILSRISKKMLFSRDAICISILNYHFRNTKLQLI